jgi:hypothetical protein
MPASVLLRNLATLSSTARALGYPAPIETKHFTRGFRSPGLEAPDVAGLALDLLNRIVWRRARRPRTCGCRWSPGRISRWRPRSLMPRHGWWRRRRARRGGGSFSGASRSCSPWPWHKPPSRAASGIILERCCIRETAAGDNVSDLAAERKRAQLARIRQRDAPGILEHRLHQIVVHRKAFVNIHTQPLQHNGDEPVVRF